MVAMGRALTQDPAVLLRYRFDCADQFRRHVHCAEGSGPMLFFPDAQGLLEVGRRALLEVSLGRERQECTLRGEVRSRAAGQAIEGAWLELPQLRQMSQWSSRGAVHARERRRFALDLPVRLSAASGALQLARLADASLAGARLSGLSAALGKGDEVQLALLGQDGGQAQLGRATVLWRSGDQAGLALDRKDLAARRAVAALVESAAARWASAHEHAHLRGCRCLEGGPIFEPVSLRAAARLRVG